jgi:hypothetical protein
MYYNILSDGSICVTNFNYINIYNNNRYSLSSLDIRSNKNFLRKDINNGSSLTKHSNKKSRLKKYNRFLKI